jgi:type VI protein secretion system component VasK
MADLVAVFKPNDGAIWQFVTQNLQKYVTKQGSQYVANPAGAVQMNPAFLGFLNRAAAFTDYAFAGGAAEPKFNYTVKLEQSPDLQSVNITLNGQSATLAIASPGPKPFTWPGTGPGMAMQVRHGGQDFTYPSYDGLWGVFRFVDDADRHVGPLVEMTLRSGRSGQPVKNAATGQPVTVRLDFSANPPVFDKGYFAGFGCVAQVAK